MAHADEVDLSGKSVVFSAAYKRGGFGAYYGWSETKAGIYFAKDGTIFAFDNHFYKTSREGTIIGNAGTSGTSNVFLTGEAHTVERRGNLLRLVIRQKSALTGNFETTYIVQLSGEQECTVRAFKIEGRAVKNSQFRIGNCHIANGKADF
ncbi:MAG: hypothetical protein R3D29_15570 [Nitratireductor sp.]